MQLACFLYIKRIWAKDRAKLTNLVDYFCHISYKFSLLLFPEGTDFTETTRNLSDKFAEKNSLQVSLHILKYSNILIRIDPFNQLQKYENVLHPRTTGFTFLARKLMEKNCLDALYDVTLVYCDNIPQTEKSLMRGDFPKIVKMHFVRHPLDNLPKTEEGLRNFLERSWLQKEKIIKEFYATGNFLHGPILRRNSKLELYTTLIFWTMLPYVALYWLLYVDWFRHVVIAHTLFLLFVNFVSDGFQEFEIALHRFRVRIFGFGF